MRPKKITDEDIARWDAKITSTDPIRIEIDRACSWLHEQIELDEEAYEKLSFAFGQRCSAQSWTSYKEPPAKSGHLIGKIKVGPMELYHQIEQSAIWDTAKSVLTRYEKGDIDEPGGVLAAELSAEFMDRVFSLESAAKEYMREHPVDLEKFKKEVRREIKEIESSSEVEAHENSPASIKKFTKLRESLSAPEGKQHYMFAHLALPQTFMGKAARFLELILDQHAAMLGPQLKQIWVMCGTQTGSNNPGEGLSVEVVRWNRPQKCLLVRMPEPKATTLAYYGAVLFGADGKNRYFTLERTADSDFNVLDEGCVCEWVRNEDASLSHKNYLIKCAPCVDNFLLHIEEILDQPRDAIDVVQIPPKVD